MAEVGYRSVAGVIRTRDIADDELALVFDSWLESHRWSTLARSVTQARYFEAQRATIDRLLRGGAQLFAAYDESAPEVVLGWVCVSPQVIHYVFTKQPFRRAGVARALLGAFAQSPMRYSHEMREYKGMKLPECWVYDPYSLHGDEE